MVKKVFKKINEIHQKFWKVAAPVTVVVVLLSAYGLWYVGTHETTDDAYIEGDVIVISPKVSGHVDKVYIKDNMQVKAKDPLCDIDGRDYQVRLNLAKAELSAASSELGQAGQDAKRYQKLLDTKDISQQQYDKALLRWHTAQAQVEAAQARLSQAQLNVSYTKIGAPASGVITRKSIEPGVFVQEGQVLLAIVLPERWVIANLKETQMTHIRPGLKVSIHIDAYPGVVFHGHVDSLQQGTGSRFSLLPSENATGNFIKVVQRVPVKIVFDDPIDVQEPLALGMSVVPTIELK
ncbi:MAG: HlyD family secretion protein [Candidatus Omnitrophica bacterium]|nr:HlyD family secretion protein [Candidatus Omnitrophota bacterium]